MQVLIFFSIFIGLLYFKRLYVKKLIFIMSIFFVSYTSTTTQILTSMLDCISICSKSAKVMAYNNKSNLFNQVTSSLNVPFEDCIRSCNLLFQKVSTEYDENVFNIYTSIYIGNPKDLTTSLVASAKDMVGDLANIVKYYAKLSITPIIEITNERVIINNAFKHFAKKLSYIGNVNNISFNSLGTDNTREVLSLIAQKEFMYFMLSKVINPIIESLINIASVSDLNKKHADMNLLIDTLSDIVDLDMQVIFERITSQFNISKQLKTFEKQKTQFLNILESSFLEAKSSFAKILLDNYNQESENRVAVKMPSFQEDTRSSESPIAFFKE